MPACTLDTGPWAVIEAFAANHPLLSLWVLLALLAAPLVRAPAPGALRADPRWTRWYPRAALGLVLVPLAVVALRFLVVARPVVEGVDFFYYVLVARDLLADAPDASLARYRYFPGGYRVWEAVMAGFGGGLATLQIAALGALLANAALCALVVLRAAGARAGAMAAAAGLLYLALAVRFEGLYATTEPVATLFALLGLLAWGGKPFDGAAGWRRALLLGAGLGLALWVKQQAGLVSLGAAAIVITVVAIPATGRFPLWQLAAVPAAAAAMCLIAMGLEGEGLTPLRLGLGFVDDYAGTTPLAENLRGVFRRAPYAWTLGLAAFGGWVAMLGVSRWRRLPGEPWALVAGFALLACFAAGLQFTRRPYLHYALLAAPFLSIALALFAARGVRAAAAVRPRFGAIAALALVGVLLVPGVRTSVPYRHLQLWPPTWQPRIHRAPPWHADADIAADLDALATHVRTGERLLVLPPRRNVVHYRLGTRPPFEPGAYGWSGGDLSAVPADPRIGAALVIHPAALDRTDVETCAALRCDAAAAALADAGFEVRARLRAMTLWRRHE